MEPIDGQRSIRRTKLVCTLGPASGRRADQLVAAGMDVARLNLAHGSAAWHTATAETVRQAAAAAGRPVGLMTDLPGPKLRLGRLAGGSLALARGRPFALHDPGSIGDERGAAVSSRSVLRALRRGDRILLADGAVELRVTATEDSVDTEVVRAGRIRSGQGVNVPADRLSSPPLTARDRRRIPLVRGVGADYVAQSFVRRAADVMALRDVLGPGGPRIVAKVETRAAIDDFDHILEAADAVMIARGDMGVELSFEEVPIVQKQLVRRALDRGVPTIVATQMLESMTAAPRPTRAEVSDVANAVFDGTDAILLSAETAIGAHPVLAAEAAVRVIRRCETGGERYLARVDGPSHDMGDRAVAYAAVVLAGARPDITAIVCSTRTGRTARLLAALRPPVPIVAVSTDAAVAATLTLVHGVVPRVAGNASAGGAAGLVGGLRDRGVLAADASVVHLVSTGRPGSPPDRLEVVPV